MMHFKRGNSIDIKIIVQIINGVLWQKEKQPNEWSQGKLVIHPTHSGAENFTNSSTLRVYLCLCSK